MVQYKVVSVLFNFEGAGIIWGFSSAGRAPALQAGGQEFDSLNLHQNGLIAQLVRISLAKLGTRLITERSRSLFESGKLPIIKFTSG